MPVLATRLRIFVVSGAFSDCRAPATVPFEEAITRLTAQGTQIAPIMGSGRSGAAHNARQIAAALRSADLRPDDRVVLVGYSKGTVDILESGIFMIGWTIACFLLLWTALHLKTSRPDGDLVKNLHPYRRIMGFIMPGRNESVVYFDAYLDAAPLVAYLQRARGRFDVDLTHCLAAACLTTLVQNPTMNRFVAGRRLYQRKRASTTFSMKRKALDRAAKLATVKVMMESGETFRDFCARVNALIGVERSGERTYADKEFDVFNALPRPVLRAGVAALRMLDADDVTHWR